MKATMLDSFVCCPMCGQRINVKSEIGECISCGQPWTVRNNAVFWVGVGSSESFRLSPSVWRNNTEKTRLEKNIFTAKKYLKRIVKLILSPAIYLQRIRIDRFYEKTINNLDLANSWAKHYLYQLNLPEHSTVLQIGCMRGGLVAILDQLGYQVAAQEAHFDDWWKNIPRAMFQVVDNKFSNLPWCSNSFDMVLMVGVIFDFDEESLFNLQLEVMRLLKPGGVAIILEGNSLNNSRKRTEVRWHGRIHSLEAMRKIALASGFEEIDYSFEGFFSPVFPTLVEYVRKTLGPYAYNLYDYDSWLDKLVKPTSRRYWLLRVRKPTGLGIK